MKPRMYTPVVMKDHIRDIDGQLVKTVCVTACLTALGVPFDSIRKTGSLQKPNYLNFFNRNGLGYRSRKSYMPKNPTIGACRKAIAKMKEDAVYFVIVHGNSYCHAMVLNNDGSTLVDTDPP